MIQEIFLQGAKLELGAKGQFAVIDANSHATTFIAKNEEEAQSWITDIGIVVSRFALSSTQQVLFPFAPPHSFLLTFFPLFITSHLSRLSGNCTMKILE